ncbi:hypothetical protein FRC20_000785, partial [Serendipita sp. 405]
WSIWAHMVKFEHNIKEMIRELGRGGREGFFLLGSLNQVNRDEATVSIRTFVLACGTRYVSPYAAYSSWSVIDYIDGIYCGIPITPVVIYAMPDLQIIGYHNPSVTWFVSHNSDYAHPFGTYFNAKFSIENTQTRTGLTQLVPDPAYRYPYDAYEVSPTLALYNNATNSSLPFIAYLVVNTANSFIADSELLDPYVCLTDTVQNMQCGDVYISLTRTRITKSMAILSLIIGWLLALMTVVLSVIAWNGPRQERSGDQMGGTKSRKEIPETILLFPIATSLALPALRSLFPAVPPTVHFGLHERDDNERDANKHDDNDLDVNKCDDNDREDKEHDDKEHDEKERDDNKRGDDDRDDIESDGNKHDDNSRDDNDREPAGGITAPEK